VIGGMVGGVVKVEGVHPIFALAKGETMCSAGMEDKAVDWKKEKKETTRGRGRKGGEKQ